MNTSASFEQQFLESSELGSISVSALIEQLSNDDQEIASDTRELGLVLQHLACPQTPQDQFDPLTSNRQGIDLHLYSRFYQQFSVSSRKTILLAIIAMFGGDYNNDFSQKRAYMMMTVKHQTNNDSITFQNFHQFLLKVVEDEIKLRHHQQVSAEYFIENRWQFSGKQSSSFRDSDQTHEYIFNQFASSFEMGADTLSPQSDSWCGYLLLQICDIFIQQISQKLLILYHDHENLEIKKPNTLSTMTQKMIELKKSFKFQKCSDNCSGSWCMKCEGDGLNHHQNQSHKKELEKVLLLEDIKFYGVMKQEIISLKQQLNTCIYKSLNNITQHIKSQVQSIPSKRRGRFPFLSSSSSIVSDDGLLRDMLSFSDPIKESLVSDIKHPSPKKSKITLTSLSSSSLKPFADVEPDPSLQVSEKFLSDLTSALKLVEISDKQVGSSNNTVKVVSDLLKEATRLDMCQEVSNSSSSTYFKLTCTHGEFINGDTEVTKGLNLGRRGDALLSAVATSFLTSELAHAQFEQFIHLVVLPKCQSLTKPASRLLVTTCTTLCQQRPDIMLMTLIVPLLCPKSAQSLANVQCELASRLIKSGYFTVSALRQLLVSLSKQSVTTITNDDDVMVCEWSDLTVSVILAILSMFKSEGIGTEAASCLIERLERVAGDLSKSPKVANLAHSIVTKHSAYFKQDDALVSSLRRSLSCLTSFMANSATAALDRLPR